MKLPVYVLFADAQLAPVYKPGGSNPSKPKAQGPKSPPKEEIRVGGPTRFTTKTVYGFLDFTTTVGNTIMVFSPKSDSEKKGPKNIKPSSTRFILRATPRPQLPRQAESSQKTVLASPVLLQSSLSEPSNARTINEARRPSNVVTAIPAVTTPKKKPPPTSRPFRFGSIKSSSRRDRKPPRRQRPADRKRDRKRYDLSYFASSVANAQSDSTIVPITVTGTGVNRATARPVHVTPSEVVVSRSQGFASLSLIDRFTNAIGNSLSDKNNDNEDNPKQKIAINPNPISGSDGLPPTGLVTTLGGTIVNLGLTTVHKTSVIGTYIKGQYAQVLLSTSRIFQTTAVDKFNPGFETVKSVIKGSATQFITPDLTAALPLEELFSSPGNDRNARYENEPSLFKRRGPTRNQFKDDPFVDIISEDDLQRSGTDLRPSFRPVASALRRQTDRNAFAEDVRPTTFRPRFTPSSTFRFGETRTTSPHRFSSPRDRERERERDRNGGKRPFVRRRPGASNRPKLIGTRRINTEKKKVTQAPVEEEYSVKPTPTLPSVSEKGVETLHSHKSKILDGSEELWVEVATVRQMHTFRVGTKKNTRFVTYTRTFTHSIEPTVVTTNNPISKVHDYHNDILQKDGSEKVPLFENILDKTARDVATLPPIDIGEGNLNALLQTVTESFSTVETMLKTSVLPVIKAQLTVSHTLTQTYLITRIVTAIKTIPPIEAFDFIAENSLNEFNDKLLAEGTENEHSLLPGELEYDENSGTRVKPPPGFRNKDTELADLAGGQFNPDALEQRLNPELSAALKGVPQLASGQTGSPDSITKATPQLSPEQLQQLAYLQLINPYAALQGGFNPLKPQMTVTSSPVTITTDVTTTTTRVLRVIFNARPIYTTLTSTEVVRTTLTTYKSSTVTASPQLPFGAFPFPGMPFAAG